MRLECVVSTANLKDGGGVCGGERGGDTVVMTLCLMPVHFAPCDCGRKFVA